jgi:hypothetical protein
LLWDNYKTQRKKKGKTKQESAEEAEVTGVSRLIMVGGWLELNGQVGRGRVRRLRTNGLGKLDHAPHSFLAEGYQRVYAGGAAGGNVARQ